MSFEESKIITYPNMIFKQEYRIDTKGNIWTPFRGWSLMSQMTNKQGYKEIFLYTENYGRKSFKIHRLVMETFKPIKNSSELQVNHIDGNKSNNDINNLEWCTRSENILHAFKTGLEQKPKGEKNGSHKLTDLEVQDICERLSRKETLQSIADIYHVSKATIGHIKQRRNWTHISKDYLF